MKDESDSSNTSSTDSPRSGSENTSSHSEEDIPNTFVLTPTEVESTLVQFFGIMLQPKLLHIVLNGVQLLSESDRPQNSEASRFPQWIASLVRYHDFSKPFFINLIQDSLESLSSPQLLFRVDHISTRILREYTAQILGTSLTKTLKKVVSLIGVQRLSPTQIVRHVNELLELIYGFRYPRELLWYYHIISETIKTRFPGSERMGLASIFFLRYLCPIILTSPETFDVENTAVYRENSIKLVKIIQNMANGNVANLGDPGVDPVELKLYSAKEQSQMNSFFEFLASGKDDIGTSVQAPLLSCVSLPSIQAIKEFFSVISAIRPQIEQDVHAQVSDKSFHEMWSRFLRTWDPVATSIAAMDLDSLQSLLYPNLISAPKAHLLSPMAEPGRSIGKSPSIEKREPSRRRFRNPFASPPPPGEPVSATRSAEEISKQPRKSHLIQKSESSHASPLAGMTGSESSSSPTVARHAKHNHNSSSSRKTRLKSSLSTSPELPATLLSTSPDSCSSKSQILSIQNPSKSKRSHASTAERKSSLSPPPAASRPALGPLKSMLHRRGSVAVTGSDNQSADTSIQQFNTQRRASATAIGLQRHPDELITDKNISRAQTLLEDFSSIEAHATDIIGLLGVITERCKADIERHGETPKARALQSALLTLAQNAAKFVDELNSKRLKARTSSQLRDALGVLLTYRLHPSAGEVRARPQNSVGTTPVNSQQHLKLRLKAVKAIACPTVVTNFSPSLVQIANWSNRMVLRWLDANDLQALNESFQAVDGDGLLSGRFVLPEAPIMTDRLKRKFDFAFDQLKRSSLDPFDAASFSTPDQQILALKEAVTKLALLYNTATSSDNPLFS